MYQRKVDDLLTSRQKVIDVGKYSLFIGNQDGAGGFCDKWNRNDIEYSDVKKLLQTDNIVAIVSCADNVEAFPHDFKYLQLNMQNNSNFDIKPRAREAYRFITDNIKAGSVFVHCNAGCTRSASIVIYFLMKYLNWTFDMAYNHLYNVRTCIDVDIFKNQLMELQSDILELQHHLQVE